MKAIVTVHGVDRVGIIAALGSKLASLNININDIRQTTMQEQFNMIMMVDTEHCTVSFKDIIHQLNELGKELHLEISIRSKEIFDAMHNI